ncbi:MAG: hypothetical protein Q7T53_02095 [Deltaproteobacteria bacterium]|nr:hypothetical protein [Deltaproteobacteria bacterium]
MDMKDTSSENPRSALDISNQTVQKAEEHPNVASIKRIIAPLKLRISNNCPRRVNVLIGIMDFKYVFGGYISVFNLVLHLIKEGYNVRVIIIDECGFEPLQWRSEIKKYEGLENFFDFVEVIYAGDREETIECSGKDVFLSTSWWSSYVANDAIKQLNSEKFIYLSQEYEPIFYEMGTIHLLADSSYDLPYYAIFSTELVRDYHRRNKIGLFKDTKSGEECSVSFQNAILKFDVSEKDIKERKTKKLLFYARPEPHAARNLFEAGMIALSNAIRDGHFDDDEWEFYGIGTVNAAQKIHLCNDVELKLLPKVSLNEYKELLPGFDLGLSLMYSPHPSLVPTEMCAAGMIVVTNTYANKTADVLREISTNFVPAEPTLEGIEKALAIAAKKVNDHESRVNGSKVNWSQSWEDSFGKDFMDKVKKFIGYEGIKGHTPVNLSRFESREERIAKAFLKIVSEGKEAIVSTLDPADYIYQFYGKKYAQDLVSYNYFKAGFEITGCIERILSCAGKDFNVIRDILVNQNGYGYLTRFLVYKMDPNKIFVLDNNINAVSFQKEYLKVNGFSSETHSKKKFEIIVYINPLMTDPRENNFEESLEHLYSLLDDDGVLIFSANKSRSDIEKWAVIKSITNLYCLEKELEGRQDVFIVTKRYVSSLNRLLPNDPPTGNIDSIQVSEGNLIISGWAVDKKRGAVEEAKIYCDGKFVGRATLNIERPDVRDSFKNENYLCSGWLYNGTGESGTHTKGNVMSLDEVTFVLLRNQRNDITFLRFDAPETVYW